MQADARQTLDNTLLHQIHHHDESALAELYDRYIRLVYTVALRITGERQTAEEVVQDVFQNVWHTAGSFRADAGSCATWILSITRHRAYDAMRSKRERARTREHALVSDWPINEESQPEHEVSLRLLRDDVRAALQTLPLNQRQAIELAYYGGLTRSEIAAHLGEPLGTVKTRLRLGLLKLRDALTDPFGALT